MVEEGGREGERGENLVSLLNMSVNLINSRKLLWVSKDPKKFIALSQVLQALAQV